MIKGLHHNAYRCRDAEETRKFYEDFLGLPLVNAFRIEQVVIVEELDELACCHRDRPIAVPRLSQPPRVPE